MKSFIKVLLLAIPIAITSCNEAKKPLEHEFTMKVWEKGAPESNNLKGPEYFNKDSTDVFNISVPEINIFLTQEANSGKMVLICPGGGYGMQAINKEGWEMARWLNKKGVNAAVLKYRLPNGNKDIPLNDALKAMKILKENSKDRGINRKSFV